MWTASKAKLLANSCWEVYESFCSYVFTVACCKATCLYSSRVTRWLCVTTTSVKHLNVPSEAVGTCIAASDDRVSVPNVPCFYMTIITSNKNGTRLLPQCLIVFQKCSGSVVSLSNYGAVTTMVVTFLNIPKICYFQCYFAINPGSTLLIKKTN